MLKISKLPFAIFFRTILGVFVSICIVPTYFSDLGVLGVKLHLSSMLFSFFLDFLGVL